MRETIQNREELIEDHKSKGDFVLSVYDNGVLFQNDTLRKIGKEKFTTHASSGGSGIGLMIICELCRNNSASLEIDALTENSMYAKRVSVAFDGKRELRIYNNGNQEVSETL